MPTQLNLFVSIFLLGVVITFFGFTFGPTTLTPQFIREPLGPALLGGSPACVCTIGDESWHYAGEVTIKDENGEEKTCKKERKVECVSGDCAIGTTQSGKILNGVQKLTNIYRYTCIDE